MDATVEMRTRRGTLTPASFNADAMTIEAVFTTFADYQRHGYTERLARAGADLSRLVGAPVLDGHQQDGSHRVIGVVDSYRNDGDALVGTIRLSAAPDVASPVTKIMEGVLRHVSIGYVVTRWAESTDPQTRKRVRTATAWQIREVSAVAIPADPGASFRKESTMPEDNQVIEPTALETRAAIRTIARTAGMTTEQADDMVDRDLTVIEARAEAFEAMQVRARATPRIRTHAPANDDPSVIMTRRVDALYARVAGTAPTPEARPFMEDSLKDIAKACVEAAGISTRGLSPDELFTRAMHTTSDFPNLLTGTGNRTLMAGYQAAQSPIKTTLARQSTIADFRAKTMLKLSDVGLLQEVSESGEVKHTTRGEAIESYALKTYATQFSLSRKALINDDLGAFGDWGATAGRMAAETETNLLLALLLSNPVMGEDSTALFHANHHNLAASGTALEEPGAGAALIAARKAMRTVKGLDGVTPINAAPKYLLVGPEQESFAEQHLAAIYAATTDDVNPFAGRLTLLVEPRITDDRWYLFADPASLPVLEYSYLSSAQGPQMASREGFDVLGMEFRVVLDFGTGAVDFRGAYLNPGD